MSTPGIVDIPLRGRMRDLEGVISILLFLDSVEDFAGSVETNLSVPWSNRSQEPRAGQGRMGWREVEEVKHSEIILWRIRNMTTLFLRTRRRPRGDWAL